MNNERISEKPPEMAQPESQSQPGVPRSMTLPGEYYFVPGTDQIRPEILEKMRQTRQGRH